MGSAPLPTPQEPWEGRFALGLEVGQSPPATEGAGGWNRFSRAEALCLTYWLRCEPRMEQEERRSGGQKAVHNRNRRTCGPATPRPQRAAGAGELEVLERAKGKGYSWTGGDCGGCANRISPAGK